MNTIFKNLPIESTPFIPIANERLHEADYIGRVTDGTFKGFNVFKNQFGHYIVMFGRTQEVTIVA